MIRTGYGIVCFVIAILCLGMAAKCFKKQEKMAKVTGAVCLSGAFLVFFNSLTSLFNQPLFCSAALSCMLVCADLFLYFVLTYTMDLTEVRPLHKICKIVLWCFILLDSVVILGNPWTNVVLDYAQKQFFEETFFVIVPKLWYYVHCVYIYASTVIVIILLIRKCARVPLVYAGRYLMELTVVLSVVAVNLLYLIVRIPMDVSCVLYGWAAYAMYQSALNYRPRFLRKEARYLMTNTLQEPMVLFDISDRLADFNVEAAEKFHLSEADLCNMTREYFETGILKLEYEKDITQNINREIVLQTEYADISYQLTLKKLYSKRSHDMGIVYAFQNVSEQKMMYNALENMAAYDSLTGFYSNRIFANKLEEWDKIPKQYIVAICNLGGLKLLNSFYERKVGSSIIQIMSEELREVLPEDSLICYSDDDCTVIVAKDITEEQMNLYLSNAARKLKKRGPENIPLFLNYGVARRENTAVSVEEYIKYAVMDMLIKKGKDGSEQKKQMTQALTEIYFKNEYESSEHVNRIKKLAECLAEKLNLSTEEKEKLSLLCDYHDIGRVKTREEVWSRAAVITRDELDIIKLHSITGYQIVSQMELEHDISDLILYHHENYDGSGYPYGLSGEEIPLLSRILAIVDSYDVMINNQLYKEAVSEETALDELKKYAGSQFDPALVNLFEECLKERK